MKLFSVLSTTAGVLFTATVFLFFYLAVGTSVGDLEALRTPLYFLLGGLTLSGLFLFLADEHLRKN